MRGGSFSRHYFDLSINSPLEVDQLVRHLLGGGEYPGIGLESALAPSESGVQMQARPEDGNMPLTRAIPLYTKEDRLFSYDSRKTSMSSSVLSCSSPRI